MNTLTSLIQNETFMELLRMGIVYVHLLACCVAVGLVLTSDISMAKKMLKHGAAATFDKPHFNSLQKVVSLSLAILWLTGISIIGLDVSGAGLEYFNNPKIQAKIIIVSLLTLNGILLHNTVMPLMLKAGSMLRMTPNAQMLAVTSGTFSAVSWFYAAMLGIARPLSWKYSLTEVMAFYPLLIVAGITGMLALISVARRRDNGQYSLFASRQYA